MLTDSLQQLIASKLRACGRLQFEGLKELFYKILKGCTQLEGEWFKVRCSAVMNKGSLTFFKDYLVIYIKRNTFTSSMSLGVLDAAVDEGLKNINDIPLLAIGHIYGKSTDVGPA